MKLPYNIKNNNEQSSNNTEVKNKRTKRIVLKCLLQRIWKMLFDFKFKIIISALFMCMCVIYIKNKGGKRVETTIFLWLLWSSDILPFFCCFLYTIMTSHNLLNIITFTFRFLNLREIFYGKKSKRH